MRKRTIGILLGMAVLAFASGRVSTAIDSVYAAEESDTSDDEEDEMRKKRTTVIQKNWNRSEIMRLTRSSH